jgi:hypothetical protein
MSDFITVKLPDSEKAKFRKWTDSLSKENKRDCQNIMVSTILKIEKLSKTLLTAQLANPTSFLASNIHPSFTPDKLGGSVFVNRGYAPYVEFGTGTKVVAPADVSEYAMTFKGEGKRKVNLRARPYLFPAVRIAQKEMISKLENLGFKKV